MEDILGHKDSVLEPEGEEKWWPMARSILTIFIETDGVSPRHSISQVSVASELYMSGFLFC